ncbi:unnamed protein product [Ilex paraguariensis]|uniref:Uncharacterized protein n=1 Tax=Ilex paraguariensis TaxID=185542 RepID=A0ABC8R4Z8_9AQUA
MVEQYIEIIHLYVVLKFGDEEINTSQHLFCCTNTYCAENENLLSWISPFTYCFIEGGPIYIFFKYLNCGVSDVCNCMLIQCARVSVNFGKEPFVFDLKAYEEQERAKQQMMIEKISVPQNASYG